MTTYSIGVIIGSLSLGSLNRRLFSALSEAGATTRLHLTEIPIRDLPFYNYENKAPIPVPVGRFKAAIEAADAVIILTPEYNRSIPGVLKNALDWASRPAGDNSFARKPSAVIGAATGVLGTALAQQHLRNILSFLNSPQLSQPEAYIYARSGVMDDEGRITDEDTARFLLRWLRALRRHIERLDQHSRNEQGDVALELPAVSQLPVSG